MGCNNKKLEGRLAKIIQDQNQKKDRLPPADVTLDPDNPIGPTLDDWTYDPDKSLIDANNVAPLTIQNSSVNDKQISFRTLDDDLRARMIGEGGEIPTDIEDRLAALEAEQIVQNDRLTALEDAPVPGGSLIDADRALMMGPESEELVPKPISRITSAADVWLIGNIKADNSDRWMTSLPAIRQVPDPTGEFPFGWDYGYTTLTDDLSLTVFNRNPGTVVANDFTLGVGTSNCVYWTAWYQISYEKLQVRNRSVNFMHDDRLPGNVFRADGSTSLTCIFTCEVVQVDLVPIPQADGANMTSLSTDPITDPGQVLDQGSKLPTAGRGNGIFVMSDIMISGRTHGFRGGPSFEPFGIDPYKVETSPVGERSVSKPMFGSPISITEPGWYSVMVQIAPWAYPSFHNELHYVLRIGGTCPPMMTDDDPRTGVEGGGIHTIRNISLRPVGIDPPGKGFMRL